MTEHIEPYLPVPQKGDTRVVVEPSQDKKWSWKIEIYVNTGGFADWAAIKVYPKRDWGFADTEEEAHAAGAEAIKEFYADQMSKKAFKKYRQKNTTIKFYKRSDYIDE